MILSIKTTVDVVSRAPHPLQEVEHRDQELAQLTVELSTLEQRRQSLENQVTHSQTQVQSLEEARQQAQQEITSLQDEVQRLEEAVQDSSLEEEGLQETLAEKGVELEAVKEEKNALEKQVSSVMLQSVKSQSS